MSLNTWRITNHCAVKISAKLIANPNDSRVLKRMIDFKLKSAGDEQWRYDQVVYDD